MLALKPYSNVKSNQKKNRKVFKSSKVIDSNTTNIKEPANDLTNLHKHRKKYKEHKNDTHSCTQATTKYGLRRSTQLLIKVLQKFSFYRTPLHTDKLK